MTARHRNERGWWRRLRASSADLPTFDPDQLRSWNRYDALAREREQRNRRADRRWLAFRSEL